MESTNYVKELNAPPKYNAHGSDQLNDEMEFRQIPGQQSTVVTIMPDEPPIRDHIIWSIFNAIYMNMCCLGVIALVFSVKARDRKHLGDKNGARSYGSTARSLNIAATIIGIVSIVIGITIFVVQMAMVLRLIREDPHYRFEGH